MRDMWGMPYTKRMRQQRWRKLRQKGSEPASNETVFAAICEVLEENGYNKLLILFKMQTIIIGVQSNNVEGEGFCYLI